MSVVDAVTLVSVAGGGSECFFFGIGGAVVPAVFVTTAVPAVSLPSGFGFVGMVNAVVVSTFVSVTGGLVSPGPLMVDVTPLADPSGTTSYCFWSRCILPDRLHEKTRRANAARGAIFRVIENYQWQLVCQWKRGKKRRRVSVEQTVP
jgi:hypothetical protein